MAMYIKDGKNLFTVTNTLLSGITYDKTTGEMTIKAGAYAWSSPLYTFSTPIPANTKVSVRLFVKKGKIGGTNPISIGFYHVDPNTWQGQASIPQNTDLTGTVYTTTWVTTNTATHIWIFLNNTTIVEEDVILRVACCYGEPMETFEPYNYARRVKVLDKYGIRNLFNVDAITGVENNAARIIRKGKGIGISRGAYSSGLIFKGNEVYLPVGEYTFSAIVENDMDEYEYDYAYVALWGLTSKATLSKMTKVFAKSKEKLVYNFSVTTADTYGFRLQGKGDTATASDMKFYYYDIQLVKGTYTADNMPEYRPFTKILNPKIFAKS